MEEKDTIIEIKNGFRIICDNCGYDKCEEIEDWDYDYDDEPYLLDRYFYCPQCGQSDR